MKKKVFIISIFIIPLFVTLGIQKVKRVDSIVKATWTNTMGETGECAIKYDSGNNHKGDCNNIPLQVGKNIITLTMIDAKGKSKSGKFIIDYDGKKAKKFTQF